ncbi:MAG: MFS transporter [Lactobacillaceae bacterium]|jgi:EmrB/QacA subfamily drug resistance transporter|nr:MFS transporter [Lactobacillaceae bacterium]
MTDRADEIEENKMPPKIVSWLISCAFFMQMIDGTILNTALPEIAKDINENPLEIQSIIIAYMLTVASLLPLSGWMADKVGAKKIFIYAVGVFTLGSLFCALSYDLTTLVVSRVFQGIGGALMVPVGRLIVLKLYPKDQLVKVLSFVLLPALFGPILGPPLGGFIVEYLSWHWIFLINLPIGIIAMFLIKAKMPEIKKEPTNNFDWAGFISLSLAIVLICIATNRSSLIASSYIHKIVMIVSAAILMTFFWFYINKSKKPLFNPELIKIRTFTTAILGNLFTRLGFAAMPLLLPLLFQVGLGMSPSKSGSLLLTIGFASILGKFAVEKLIKLMGYRNVLTLNTVFVGSIVCCFAFITKETSEISIILLLILMGTINSIQFTTMNTITLIDLPKRRASDGNSVLSVIMQVSMVLGISVGSSMLNMFEGIYPENLLKAFHITFIVLGIFTILSSITFVFIPKKAGGLKR